VGRVLWAALAEDACRSRLATIRASVQADNERAVRFLLAVAPGARSHYAGDAQIDVTLPIATAICTQEAA
jgi:hypothetical protein